MPDQFFIGPGHSQSVFGIEKEIEGGKPVDFQVVVFVDAIRIIRGVNMDFVAELDEFLGEYLGGGRHSVDAGKISVGNESDFHLIPFKNMLTIWTPRTLRKLKI